MTCIVSSEGLLPINEWGAPGAGKLEEEFKAVHLHIQLKSMPPVESDSHDNHLKTLHMVDLKAINHDIKYIVRPKSQHTDGKLAIPSLVHHEL